MDEIRTFAEDLGEVDVSAYLDAGEGQFHTQNDPNAPWQRDNIIERKGRVDVRCEHKDIVHGYFSDAVDDACTLIVLVFRFDPNGLGRRIKEAAVTMVFSAMAGDDDHPEVLAMHPDGNFAIVPTTQHETRTKGGGVTIGGGVAGLSLGAHLTLERTIECDTTDAARVRGSIDLRNRNWGRKNSVSWTLWENRTAKTGVLPAMTAAILLRRSDMRPFKAAVTVKVVADTWTALSSAFASEPQDDDVWYDPGKKPASTDRLRKYDADNLGVLDLAEIAGGLVC